MTTTSAKDILVTAKSLLEEKGWTQGYYARDIYNDRLAPWKQEAVCFCTVGALIRVSGELRFQIAHGNETKNLSLFEKQELLDAIDVQTSLARDYLFKGVGAVHTPTWNDDPTRTKQDVLDAYDRGIALCQQAITTTV